MKRSRECDYGGRERNCGGGESAEGAGEEVHFKGGFFLVGLTL